MLVPELAQLAADQADQLGGYRIGELAAAMAALGVTDHRFLGGAGRYRDSGMMGTPGQRAPAGLLERRPRRGGRRTPSPSSARSARRSWSPTTRTAATATPTTSRPTGSRWARSRPPPTPATGPTWASRGRSPRSTGAACRARCCSAASTRSAAQGETFFEGVTDADDVPFAVPDDEVAAAVDGARVRRRARTPRCGPTPPRSPSTGRSSRCRTTSARRCCGIEYYRLVRGERGPAGGGPDGLGGRPVRRSRPDDRTAARAR